MDMVYKLKRESIQFLESKIKETKGSPMPFIQQMNRILETALQMKRAEEAAARAAAEASARQEAERIARLAKIKEEIIALSTTLTETRSALAEVLAKEKEEMDLLKQALKQEAITADEINQLTERCVELIKQIEFCIRTLIDTSGHAPYADCNLQNFRADIDEVRVYDRPLNEKEKDSEQDCEKISSYLTRLQTEIDHLSSTCNSPAANIINEAAIEGLRKSLTETKVLLDEAIEQEKAISMQLEKETQAEKNQNKELANLKENYNRLIKKEIKLFDAIKTSFYDHTSPTLFTADRNKTNQLDNTNQHNVAFTP